ncbi:DUF488 domain-containing protein [Comamonas thiooxydans]|uniref:DUF488 domain-containing protein n=1 Tax=Comamonas thiooxydans TaxID=363952 RepID=UPI002449B05F|nr:DUF488 domain-containing protein [Comamonas thiooxydans]MDH1475795.1 DUF488 domain-containing protein [Comamonas thiooxydans]
MSKNIFTIGFTQKSAEIFFSLLKTNGVQRLVDTRLNNTGQLAGFSKRDDLKYFCKAIADISYIHWEESAPEESALKAFKSKNISWEVYANEYISTLQRRKVELSSASVLGDSACLLCSEAKPHQCHRSLLAKYLTEKSHIQHKVIHL